MTTALYFRVSTDKQETAAQRHAVLQWCLSQGYPVDELQTYEDEGISGATMARPGFQRLLADVRAGKIKRVVTFELSRFSRDFVAFIDVLGLFNEHGVVVEVPGEGVQGFTTSTDKLLAAVKGFTASQFLEDHKKRVKAGIASAKANGAKWGPKLGEQRALGHRKDYGAENPDLVKRILALKAKGLSTYTIAEAVSNESLKITQSKVVRILRRQGLSRAK